MIIIKQTVYQTKISFPKKILINLQAYKTGEKVKQIKKILTDNQKVIQYFFNKIEKGILTPTIIRPGEEPYKLGYIGEQYPGLTLGEHLKLEKIYNQKPNQRKKYIIEKINNLIEKELGLIEYKIEEVLENKLDYKKLMDLSKIILWKENNKQPTPNHLKKEIKALMKSNLDQETKQRIKNALLGQEKGFELEEIIFDKLNNYW